MLDSQNFGVPQRRRRVFIVASLGDHRRPVEILFERESGFWNLETSRKKRKTVTRKIETSIAVNSFQKAKRAQSVDDYESWVEAEIVPTLNVFDSGDSRTTTIVTQEPVLFEGNRVGDPRVHNEVSPSVIARWGTGGNNVPLTLAQRQSNSEFVMDKVSSTVTAHEHKQFSDLVIEEPKAFDTYNHSVNEINQTLRKGAAGHDHIGTIWKDSFVRRLTPKECERLQGFPDDWTASQADSSRYKMMGNAVTVPVVEWIARRMVKLVAE